MQNINVNDPEYVPKYASEFSATRMDNIIIINFFYDDPPCGSELPTSKIVARIAMPIRGAKILLKDLSTFINQNPEPETDSRI